VSRICCPDIYRVRPISKGGSSKGIALTSAVKGTVTGSSRRPAPIINLIVHSTDIALCICCRPGEGWGIVIGRVRRQCCYGYRWRCSIRGQFCRQVKLGYRSRIEGIGLSSIYTVDKEGYGSPGLNFTRNRKLLIKGT